MTESLTPLSPADRHRAAAAEFARIAATVTDWDAQSPVPEWRARNVVEHLVQWLPGFLGAAGVELPGAPDGAGEPAAAFGALTVAVGDLLDAPDAAREVTFPGLGTMPLDQLIDRFYVADVYMHTWDLARSNGLDPDLDPEFAAGLRAGLASMGPMLRESGQFGTEQPVADDADDVRKLMAFIGRDPNF